MTGQEKMGKDGTGQVKKRQDKIQEQSLTRSPLNLLEGHPGRGPVLG